MFRKPPFWIAFGLISVGCIIFAFAYFSEAFPLVTLDLQMDRQTAFESAKELSAVYNWGPDGFGQAASFRLDTDVQNFVELAAGGTGAFRRMLGEGLYSPYTWRVRHFREGQTNETLIRFTPQGKPYGFIEKLPEDEPGASLTPDSARAIAEVQATTNWQIDLSAYELVEESQQIRPGGRTDHTFVYERPDAQIGEGRYRLRLVVGGDRLTEVTHFIKIPEAFSRRYEEMRSANNTIASISIVTVGVLYVLGGCVVGLFLLLRRRWVIWRKPLFWGVCIAFLQVLAGINQWPLAWMDYDTALSAHGFLLQQIIQLLANFVFLGLLISGSFMAAESLSRKAFPHHIQQWRLWSSGVANSTAILGRTIGGYLLVSVFWAYEVALYFFSTKVLGWWTPSEALFQPDVLATYFPWLSPIAISAQAGFWEESLFRAVPIAGAALLGERFGKRKVCIAAGFIVQALVFSAAHANYPTQPAYARLMELIIPSLGFGVIYIAFGLMPAIVLHFAFDVVGFALPLFVSSAPGIWVNQLFIVTLTLVPLWVVLVARWRSQQWVKLSEDKYNLSWVPPAKVAGKIKVAERPATGGIYAGTRRLIPIAGLVGLAIWLLSTNFTNDAPSLMIQRNDAKQLAREVLLEHGIDLPESTFDSRDGETDWKVLSSVEPTMDQQHRFVWQTGGQEIYKKLMGEYLPPPHWKIRFARFKGDVAERAEEYHIFIAGRGNAYRVNHKLPEARPGASLTEDEARAVAHSTLANEYYLIPAELKEISAVESKLPNRRDWVFTFADTTDYPLKEGEARITIKIAGDRKVDGYRFVYVPEEWSRQERNQENLTKSLSALCRLLTVLLLLSGAIGGIVSWSRQSREKKFSVPAFATFLALMFGVGAVNLINNWPSTVAQFSTAEPISNQIFSTIAFSLVGSLFLAATLALIVGLVHGWKSQQSENTATRPLVLGLSLGAAIAGLAALTARFSPQLQPFWAGYAAAGSYIPQISSALNPLAAYITETALFLLIFVAVDRLTRGWTRSKGPFAVALILSGLVLVGASSVVTPAFWLISGLIAGVALLLLYYFVLRFRLSLIPLASGILAMLDQIRNASFQAYTGAVSGSILAVVLIVLFSFYWFRKLDVAC